MAYNIFARISITPFKYKYVILHIRIDWYRLNIATANTQRAFPLIIQTRTYNIYIWSPLPRGLNPVTVSGTVHPATKWLDAFQRRREGPLHGHECTRVRVRLSRRGGGGQDNGGWKHGVMVNWRKMELLTNEARGKAHEVPLVRAIKGEVCGELHSGYVRTNEGQKFKG